VVSDGSAKPGGVALGAIVGMADAGAGMMGLTGLTNVGVSGSAAG
jgi:hypothetical protein